MMSIEEIKEIQRTLECPEVHIVHLAEDGFTIAHTDNERRLAALYPAAMPLEDCALHSHLMEEGQDYPVGLYYAYPPDREFLNWQLEPVQ